MATLAPIDASLNTSKPPSGSAPRSPVISGEDEPEFTALAASYREQFQPIGPEESLLLEKIVTADWTQRRMYRLEAEVFNTLIAQLGESVENPLGAAFLKDCEGPRALQKIFRCREAASREWYRALAELRARQEERLAVSAPEISAALAALAPALPPPMPNPAPQLPPRGKIGFAFDNSTPPAWRL